MGDLLTSKKFLAAVMAAIVAFVATLNDVPPDQVAVIIGPVAAYILGQGMADLGKERAKIEQNRDGG